MNWYSIFYWITVADGIKDFFDAFSDLFSWGAVIAIIVTIFVIVYSNDKNQNFTESDEQSNKYWITFWRRTAIWFSLLAFITWGGYVFTPTKKDALLIVAGGAVGQFITTDSSAKQIPAEAMTLLRTKIRSEIMELNNPIASVTDTLQEKSKEELIELLKNKK